MSIVHHYHPNNKNKIRSSTTFLMALLIVFFLLYNIGLQTQYENKVKNLEKQVETLDEELRIAQVEIMTFIENTDFKETLTMFQNSKNELNVLVKRIDDLTEDMGE